MGSLPFLSIASPSLPRYTQPVFELNRFRRHLSAVLALLIIVQSAAHLSHQLPHATAQYITLVEVTTKRLARYSAPGIFALTWCWRYLALVINV
jgi:hypothetical protein